jgi:hypothetical protein
MPCGITSYRWMVHCCNTCRRWVGNTSILQATISNAIAVRSGQGDSGRYVRFRFLSVLYSPFPEVTPCYTNNHGRHR